MSLTIQIAVLNHLAAHQVRKDHLKREEGKRYRAKHRDQIAAWHRKNYQQKGDKIREYGKSWYQENRERKLAVGKAWRDKNRVKFKATQKRWEKNNPDKVHAKQRRMYQKHKVKRNKASTAANKRRYHADPTFRMRTAMYRHLNKTIARQHMTAHCQEILGCTFEQLKSHLESQFKAGMTWANYGLRGWHIDHRLPISKHDLTNPDHIRRCFHFSNLQPLWWDENIRKSNKILPEFGSPFLLANVAASN